MIDSGKLSRSQRVRGRQSVDHVDFRPLSERLAAIAEEAAIAATREFEEARKKANKTQKDASLRGGT